MKCATGPRDGVPLVDFADHDEDRGSCAIRSALNDKAGSARRGARRLVSGARCRTCSPVVPFIR
jgi:hypothetical protein